MLYTSFKIKDKEYKCRLTAKACVELEKRMGKNPLLCLYNVKDTQELPKLEDLILILHASLQAFESGISIEDTYAMYDDFVDEGNSLTELIPIILEIFKVSGFFKEPKN